MVHSELITQDYWKACVRAVRAAIVGLEKLSDAEVATYLNAHTNLISYVAGCPAIYTAAMVHEVRTALI